MGSEGLEVLARARWWRGPESGAETRSSWDGAEQRLIEAERKPRPGSERRARAEPLAARPRMRAGAGGRTGDPRAGGRADNRA